MVSTGKMEKWATISECGLYRYQLMRDWNPTWGRVVWVMLNPSTADAAVDDQTIRKCMAFATRWGYGSITVVNIFAFRSTDPSKLKDAADPFGPKNAHHVREVLRSAMIDKSPCIAAWGSSSSKLDAFPKAVDQVKSIVYELDPSGHEFGLHCLGINKDGMPKHPLYLSLETQRTIWPSL